MSTIQTGVIANITEVPFVLCAQTGVFVKWALLTGVIAMSPIF
jgi:hypothetical protein